MVSSRRIGHVDYVFSSAHLCHDGRRRREVRGLRRSGRIPPAYAWDTKSSNATTSIAENQPAKYE